MFIFNPFISIVLKTICAFYLIYFGYKAKIIEKEGDTSFFYTLTSWVLLFLAVISILILK